MNLCAVGSSSSGSFLLVLVGLLWGGRLDPSCFSLCLPFFLLFLPSFQEAIFTPSVLVVLSTHLCGQGFCLNLLSYKMMHTEGLMML